jgi:hypothetical protein
MAYQFNGTTQYLNCTSAPATVAPLTIACWARRSNVAGNPAMFVQLSNLEGLSGGFGLIHNTATNTIRANLQVAGGVGQVAITTSGMSNNTWHHCCSVFASSTSRTAYIDAGNSGTNTASVVPNAVDNILIGVAWFGSYSTYADALIAEVGIWNVALTAAEIASLAGGMTCDKVRPQSLVFYAPLVRNLQDVKGGLTITNNNTATVAAHPRVYA